MNNLFEEFLNHNSVDINEYQSEPVYTTEAVFANDLIYNKTLSGRVFYLPKGNPVGRGNICVLYSESIDTSIELMIQRINFLSQNRYTYYFIPQKYRGRMYNKTYNINMRDELEANYKLMKTKASKIKPIKKLKFNVPGGYNVFFDIRQYLSIHNKICGKLAINKRLKEYWNLITSILNLLSQNQEYSNKFILVNCSDYPLKGSLRDNLSSPLFAIYYTALKYPNLLSNVDVDFYFFANKKALKINPSKIADKSMARIIKTEMRKLYAGVVPDKDLFAATNDDKNKDDEIVINTSANLLDTSKVTTNQIMHLAKVVDNKEETTKEVVTDTKIKTTEIEKKIESKAKQAKEEVEKRLDENNLEADPEEKEKLVEKKLEADINADVDLISEIYDEITKDKPKPKSSASTARDEMLRKEQEKLTINKMTVKDLRKISADDITIPTADISKSVHTTNNNMKTIRYDNMDKQYGSKIMPKDIMNSFLSLNDKSIPMYIRKIDVEETSDSLNYKDTYTVYYEDENRQRHTIKVDIPKLIDGRYIYIGGNKKIIKAQLFLNPVVKCAEDTVQIVTNYNKIFMYRLDTKSVSSVEKLKKLIKSNDEFKKHFKFGNAFPSNKPYITTVEYDELSKIIINYKTSKLNLMFDQPTAVKYAEDHGINIPPKHIFIGLKESKPIFINMDTQKTRDDKYIIEVMYESFTDADKLLFDSTKSPKRLMYTSVTLMSKKLPVILLLGYWEGLTNVMKKANISFELVSKAPRNLPPNKQFIRFSDCYLVYDNTTQAALLLNGLNMIKPESYTITEFNKPEPYIDFFMKVYGQANILTALQNFYEWMIDPITLERLQYLHLPTDIVSLLLYAVNLLCDSQYTSELNASVQRLRRAEVIPAILYETLAKNYVYFKNSNGRKKYSINRDSVIRELVSLTTVEDTSTLNPTLEMDIAHAVTAKGLHGTNLDEAYTLPKRSYDPSMIGTITPCASPDASVGVTKTLTIEPNIMNMRGDIKVPDEKEVENMKDVNLFSLGDLTIPLGATVDDPTRLGHAIKQSKHVIPVTNSCPVLISSGLEEVARFHLTDEFAINAEEDGEVVYYDEGKKLMIVKYKSGKCRAVNFGAEMVKNGGGGFFLANELTSPLKLGDKVKKNDVIAYHKDYFTNSKYNNCRMNMGTLTKVALMSTYQTYEDATFITEKVSRDATTKMSFCKSIVIGKNSNIFHLVKEGDHVEVGDPLAIFDTSYDDSEVNSFLASLSDTEKAIVDTNSRNTVPSKWTGEVKKIIIYSTVDIDELSPSLQKVVKAYYKKINDRNKILEQYDPESKNSIVKCGMMIKDTTSKIDASKYGVIKGDNVVDSIKIEVYIEHGEPLEIGSKVAQFSGLKNTVCEIIDKGYEPYSEYRPDEEIGTIIASNSILKRMTPSIILSVLGNKMIIELKRKLKEIYDS